MIALVSSSIAGEVLLGWRVLQELGITPDDLLEGPVDPFLRCGELRKALGGYETLFRLSLSTVGTIPLPNPESDPGGLGEMKKPGDVIHSVLDLVYSDGYVRFRAQRVKGTLVPCSTKHFAVFADGDRNHKTPLDTARYQTFVTEWGLVGLELWKARY